MFPFILLPVQCSKETEIFRDPIDWVTIMHPPVVTYRSIFKAYTFVTAAGGLPGISEFLEPVHYTWSYTGKVSFAYGAVSLALSCSHYLPTFTSSCPIYFSRTNMSLLFLLESYTNRISKHFHKRAVLLQPTYALVVVWRRASAT